MTPALSPEAFVKKNIQAELLSPQQASSEISPEDAQLLRQFADELASFVQDSTPGFTPASTPTPSGEAVAQVTPKEVPPSSGDVTVTELETPAKMFEQFFPIAANNGRFATNPQVTAEPSLQEKIAAAQASAEKIARDLGLLISSAAFLGSIYGLIVLFQGITGLKEFPQKKDYGN